MKMRPRSLSIFLGSLFKVPFLPAFSPSFETSRAMNEDEAKVSLPLAVPPRFSCQRSRNFKTSRALDGDDATVSVSPSVLGQRSCCV